MHCQNLALKMLIGRIGDELEKENIPQEVRETLERIQERMDQAIDMSISSEKLINFLVADYLDLGQLRADKFRRRDRVFKISEPLDEVCAILQ